MSKVPSKHLLEQVTVCVTLSRLQQLSVISSGFTEAGNPLKNYSMHTETATTNTIVTHVRLAQLLCDTTVALEEFHSICIYSLRK